MTAVAGALGSVIGYVGAEVASSELFERLLWPQRFYNDLSPRSLLIDLFFQPMGGPLHRAALETLDRIRENGLYRGSTRGHMLGTAFFEEKKIGYFERSADGEKKEEKQIRNGFWYEVLSLVDQGTVVANCGEGVRSAPKEDLEGYVVPPTKRAVHLFFLLDLTTEDSSPGNSVSDVEVREDKISIRTVVAVITSELSAVGTGIAAGIWLKLSWLAVFFCIPLILKLVSLLVSVRREGITTTATTKRTDTTLTTHEAKPNPQPAPKETTPAHQPPPSLYEIISPSLGFTTLRGSPSTILPFFRHYGHPVRALPSDRIREILCIILVYAYVLYFPAGLLCLLWEDPNAQYLWLAYQVYAIIAMHASRLFGLGSWGRTERRIARLLGEGKTVRLYCGAGKVVKAKLRVEEMESFAQGRKRVDGFVRTYWEGVFLS